jgi:hypothetical protein
MTEEKENMIAALPYKINLLLPLPSTQSQLV